MKRRLLILVGVLLVLFIGPMSFANVSAATYEDSSDSVTLFSETLEDDVLFSPDGYYDPTPIFASYGNDDWVDTWVFDNASWSSFGPTPEYAYFVSLADEFGIEGFDYNMLARSIGDYGAGNISVMSYGAGMTVLASPPVQAEYIWYNSTFAGHLTHDGSFPSATGQDEVAIIWLDGADGGAVQIDYMEVRFHYMPLIDWYYNPYYAGDLHYGDSFWNVSDWQFELESSPDGYSFTTDGDVATLALGYDDASNEAIRYNTTLSGLSITDYIEYRWITSPSTGGTLSTALTVYLDDIVIGTRAIAGDWTTTKLLVSDYCTVAPTTLAIHADDWGNAHATDTGYVKLDYVRIGPADEMGYQHDASTTQGVEAFNGGSISSDGDYLSLISDADGAIFNFTMDNTTTVSAISSVYYPFWEINIHPNDVGNDLQIRVQYEDDSWNTILSQFITIDSSIRINMDAVSASSIKTFQIWGYLSQTTRIDFVKAYSIANWSYYSASATTTDICYVESNALVFDKGSTNYVRWTYDPILSTDTSIYTALNVTTGTWTGGGDYSYGVDYDIGSGWEGYTFDETNYALELGTLDALRIIIRDSGTISAITFYGQVPDWIEITNVDVVFFVSAWFIINSIVIVFATEISTYTLNLLLLFLGLTMIPASTIYFVKGGRGEMSTDKLLVVILCFFMGWALFLGGIFA